MLLLRFIFILLVNHITSSMAKTRKCPPGVHPTQMPADDGGDDASSHHFDAAVIFERGSDVAPDEKTSSSARRFFDSIPPPAVDYVMSPSLPSTKEYAPTVISVRSSLAANEDDSVASTASSSSSSSHIDRPLTYDEEADLSALAEHDHICNCRWEDDAYDLWTQRRNKVAICIRCNLHFNLHKRLPAWSMLAGGKPPAAEKRPRSNPHACTETSSPLKPSQLVRIDLTTDE